MKCPYCNEEIDDNSEKCPICAEDLINISSKNKNNINKNANKISSLLGICFVALITILFIFLYICTPSKENLYEVEKGNFINSKGEKIYKLPDDYNIIGEYYEGSLIAGKFIDYVLAYIGNEKDLMALCELSIIDNKGNIIKLPFKSIIPVDENNDSIYVPVFYNGVVILINDEGKTVAINKNGKQVLNSNIQNLQKREISLKYADDHSDNLVNKDGTVIKTLKHDGWGIVGSKYNEDSMAIAYIVSNGNEISDNLSYIDSDGNVILKTKYHALYHYCTDWVTTYDAGFHNGLALVKDDNGKFIYMNKQGTPVITLTTKDCEPYNFNEELAKIYYNLNNGYDNIKLSYIDKTGKEVYSFPLKSLKTRFSINEQIYNRYYNYPKSFKSIKLDENNDLIYENYIYN